MAMPAKPESTQSPSAVRPPFPRSRPTATWPWFAMVLLSASLGCRSVHKEDLTFPKAYQPGNFQRTLEKLPSHLRRVAVLPLTCDDAQSENTAGRDTLEPLLLEELSRTRRFEVVAVSPERLQEWTGRRSWNAEDILPQGFLDLLHQRTDCDAVLFARLTQFKAYPPLVIGWRMRLADCRQTTSIWTIDEVFNAGDGPVATAARRYQQQLEPTTAHLPPAGGIVISPRRFGRYSLDAVFTTLPSR